MKWRRRMEEELERDIADHIAMEAEDNVALGMSPSEARYAALRKFGNVARVQEDTRRVWAWTALDTWYADVRQGLRKIRRTPGTAGLVIVSLALAFAPSVTVFSVMDRVFLTPIPVKAPAEIVEIMFRDTRPNTSQPYRLVSYPEFQDFRHSLRSFSGLAYQSGHGAMVALNGRRVLVGVNLVSEDYFSVLGVPLQLGPGFRAGERPQADGGRTGRRVDDRSARRPFLIVANPRCSGLVRRGVGTQFRHRGNRRCGRGGTAGQPGASDSTRRHRSLRVR